jgi:hypothetical protein
MAKSTTKIKMKTKTTSNMKHNRLIAGFLLIAATFGACKKDDEVADLSAPVIAALEIGPENNKIAHPGGDVHVEALITATSNIESVTLEINPKSGSGWKLNTVYTEGFAGLKNAEFHKHVDVPEDAALGSYNVVLKVRDSQGKETKVESTLDLQNDPSLPSQTGFEVGLNAAGNDLHAEASITAPNKIAEILVEIHGNGWEKEFSYKDVNIVGQTSYNFHKHMDVTAAPKGHYHVHLKVVDQAGKSATFEEHFDKP